MNENEMIYKFITTARPYSSLCYKEQKTLTCAIKEQVNVLKYHLADTSYNSKKELMKFKERGKFIGIHIDNVEYSNKIYALDKLVKLGIIERVAGIGCVCFVLNDIFKSKLIDLMLKKYIS